LLFRQPRAHTPLENGPHFLEGRSGPDRVKDLGLE
jgi:hypothetical protein